MFRTLCNINLGEGIFSKCICSKKQDRLTLPPGGVGAPPSFSSRYHFNFSLPPRASSEAHEHSALITMTTKQAMALCVDGGCA
jgi:hypothetical protein